jgi:23S rRNA (cytidine1920-2'-O)/16S rRNA (cytidine1409-2'-O)-methyltransferase
LASNKQRLDVAVVGRGLVVSRSQAESYIRLGKVTVNGKVVTKTGTPVGDGDDVRLTASEQYVSRAGLKLASVAEALKLDFRGKVVLDVGSSTGGFTEYALRHGATRVIAVEVGSDQLHPSLRGNPQIELHEKTDIRSVVLRHSEQSEESPKSRHRSFATAQDDSSGSAEYSPHVEVDSPDLVVGDVSFISLRDILPSVLKLCNSETQLVMMVKPQFEAAQSSLKHKGVIKNDKMRRDILKDFEDWARKYFVIRDKADSQVAGSKGNQERFYLLEKLL